MPFSIKRYASRLLQRPFVESSFETRSEDENEVEDEEEDEGVVLLYTEAEEENTTHDDEAEATTRRYPDAAKIIRKLRVWRTASKVSFHTFTYPLCFGKTRMRGESGCD